MLFDAVVCDVKMKEFSVLKRTIIFHYLFFSFIHYKNSVNFLQFKL